MALKEKEQRCIRYINAQLGEPLRDGTLEFRTWKNCADLGDIDIYHQVAQGLGQKELHQGFAGLFYAIRVPTCEGDRLGDIWYVNLIADKESDFLQRYGKQYKVTRI